MSDNPMPNFLGRYDDQGVLHDPGENMLCVWCGKPLGKIDKPFKTMLLCGREEFSKTITLPLNVEESGDNCFFYRYHAKCWDTAPLKSKEAIWNYLVRHVVGHHKPKKQTNPDSRIQTP